MRFAIAAVLVCMITPVGAATVDYTATNLSGNTWEYSYVLSPDTDDSSAGSNLFIVYFNEVFPEDLYSGLTVSGVPVGFNANVQEPDSELPLEGYFAAEGLIGGGSEISGFSVTFDYFGVGLPGPGIGMLISHVAAAVAAVAAQVWVDRRTDRVGTLAAAALAASIVGGLALAWLF